MKAILLKSFILIAICCSVNLPSQTANLTPEKDNSIYSENNNSNALGNLFSGQTGGRNGNNNRRALIKFDLSSIPSGANISSVSLTVNVNKVPSGGAGTQTYTIHQLTRDWGEGTSTGGGTGGTASANDATWNSAMQGSTTWTTPGGDFSNTPMASLNFVDTGNYTFLTNPTFVSVIQNWLDTPSMNNGLILIGDESNNRSARQLGSKDSGIAPILTVNYSTLSTGKFLLSDFSMYPNPSNNYIHLSLPQNISKATLKIYDVLGKQVENKTISNKEKADISKLEKGIYLLEVSTLGQAKTKTLIKL